MKKVTWKGNYPKKCDRCPTMIEKGDEAWKVGGGRYRHAGLVRYFCLKCGDEIQI